MYTTKYKISKSFLYNSVALATVGLVFNATSCTQNNVFTWTGKAETFEIDYDKFPSPTIQDSKILDSYFNNGKFVNMFCQDIIHKMNFNWKIWSPELVLKYQVTASYKANRLSWDLKILNEGNVLLWWTINSLKYCWTLRQDALNSVIEILPENVEISASNYVVNILFWNDPIFDMVIKYRKNVDDSFTEYEFSCKTAPFEYDDIYKIIDCICFQPHYYEGVAVEES